MTHQNDWESRLYCAWEIMYVYVARLEDGEKVAEYVSNFAPPEIGKVMSFRYRDSYESFEVIDMSLRPVTGYEMVHLKVKPLKQ